MQTLLVSEDQLAISHGTSTQQGFVPVVVAAVVQIDWKHFEMKERQDVCYLTMKLNLMLSGQVLNSY